MYKITSIQPNPFLIKTTFMKQLVFLIILSFTISHASAQNEDCKVLMDSLKGTYTGDCKSGKANGNGHAKGIHSYEGEFKNGLPEGKGKYTWSNGDYYFGGWKKGLKEGKGQMHRFENGVESMVAGYWKKDIYRGEYENPYVIQNITSEITNAKVSKISKTDKSITVSVSGLTSNSGFGAVAKMTNFYVTRGSFISKSSNTMTNKEVTLFQGVVFPFRATFNFGDSILEIEIFEEGGWDIMVPINK